MTAKVVNTIGLSLGIVGAVIIFIWGPPQPSLDPSPKLELGGVDAEIIERRAFFACMSRVGLSLIIVGFGVQVVGTWMPVRLPDTDRRGGGSSGGKSRGRQVPVPAPRVAEHTERQNRPSTEDSREESAPPGT